MLDSKKKARTYHTLVTHYNGWFDDIIGASFLSNEVITFVGRGNKYKTKLLSFTTKKRKDKK
jgi:hypothetical protein